MRSESCFSTEATLVVNLVIFLALSSVSRGETAFLIMSLTTETSTSWDFRVFFAGDWLESVEGDCSCMCLCFPAALSDWLEKSLAEEDAAE